MTSDQEWEDVLGAKLEEIETKQAEVDAVLCWRFGQREHTEAERVAAYQLVELRRQLVEAEQALRQLGAVEGNRRIVVLNGDGTNEILQGYFTQDEAIEQIVGWSKHGLYISEDRGIEK